VVYREFFGKTLKDSKVFKMVYEKWVGWAQSETILVPYSSDDMHRCADSAVDFFGLLPPRGLQLAL
jgi:hypothetical protein